MAAHIDTADYIGEVTTSLAKLARENGLGLLSFVLDMATLEATQCSERPSPEPERAASKTRGCSASDGRAASSRKIQL